MNMLALILIVLLLGFVPLAVLCLLACFCPRLRYLPAAVLAVVGFGFLVSAAGTRRTGGGVSGFGDFAILGGLIAGVVLLLAAGIAWLAAFLIHAWWRSRHRERAPAARRHGAAPQPAEDTVSHE
jgi:hypothetical protein